MAINESADWNGGEINISPDNIDVRADVTRPGVDKVKPKVWFKYSLWID